MKGGCRMKSRELGFQIKSVSNLMLRKMRSEAPDKENGEITRMQAWIIGYVYKCGDRDVFQRDLEKEFNIRRSTATGILQLMEQNGLITRSSVPYDARLKKLELTPKALKVQKDIAAKISRLEELMGEGISEEEKDTFFKVMEKIKANLAEKPI